MLISHDSASATCVDVWDLHACALVLEFDLQKRYHLTLQAQAQQCKMAAYDPVTPAYACRGFLAISEVRASKQDNQEE